MGETYCPTCSCAAGSHAVWCYANNLSGEYVQQLAEQNANSHQVAGDHYQSKAIQPWDFIAANGLGFFEGNAIKYLCRWRDKGGIADLRKAKHYIDKLIELQDE